MRYLSLFSGIEAASVAWEPLGWDCVAVAEIEPFPCAVLEHHYPNVPNLGDVTKIGAKELKRLGNIDLVVAGFPCQDFSVVGERKGLTNADGSVTRSGLFFETARIIRLAQKHCGAKWFILENVPGMLSSKQGEDFATILSELTELNVEKTKWKNSGYCSNPRPDKWSVAWRVYDAQYFGVPQRRRRVFIVGYFGGDGGREILFESESVCGSVAPSRKARKGSARGIEIGAFGGRFTEISPTLDARCKDGPIRNQLSGAALRRWAPRKVSGTLAASGAGSERPAGNANETDMLILQGKSVSRYTPVECARLQGFPDDYLDVPFRSKPAKDGPKYRALGNSFAVPVVRWIGERIQSYENSLNENAA